MLYAITTRSVRENLLRPYFNYLEEKTMFMNKLKMSKVVLATLAVLFSAIGVANASEMDLNIPSLAEATYGFFGKTINGNTLLTSGMLICFLGMAFGLWEFFRIKKLPAHKSMLDVSETIYATCTTYMKQQAKLLIILECFIAVCIVYYFAFLNGAPLLKVLNILLW